MCEAQPLDRKKNSINTQERKSRKKLSKPIEHNSSFAFFCLVCSFLEWAPKTSRGCLRSACVGIYASIKRQIRCWKIDSGVSKMATSYPALIWHLSTLNPFASIAPKVHIDKGWIVLFTYFMIRMLYPQKIRTIKISIRAGCRGSCRGCNLGMRQCTVE